MENDSPGDEREEELSSIAAIFPEIQIDSHDPHTMTLALPIAPSRPLAIRFLASTDASTPSPEFAPAIQVEDQAQHANGTSSISAAKHHLLSSLPPLELRLSLPDNYPGESAPTVSLTSEHNWLPRATLDALEDEVRALWEEYGHCQIIYSYIDFLQQSAERAFGLHKNENDVLVLAKELEINMLDFDRRAKQENFDRGTYDCGICLEPKRGTACHRMLRCGHVFCLDCLKSFYNNAITEGDVASVKCLDPSCGEKNTAASRRIRKSSRTLGPGELLQMGIEQPTVQRYVDLKRKKKLEADKTTIYCPRQWCQGPARSKKYPKVADLSQLDNYDSESDEEAKQSSKAADDKPTQPNQDRLRICEDCTYAFCRVCLAGWHGELVRCWPRSAADLSEEEKQSYDWIRLHTSPCPTCSTPCQKTHGCNHMNCYQCRTHFCYLCSAWLDPSNPYQHFNNKELGCYQRLWELEEGDPGNGNIRFEGPRGWEAAIAAAAEADANADANAHAGPNVGNQREADGLGGHGVVAARANVRVRDANAVRT